MPANLDSYKLNQLDCAMSGNAVQDIGGAERTVEAVFPRSETMNRIIWLVGLVVIVLFLAGYFGLR
jgi:hypothetical protein